MKKVIRINLETGFFIEDVILQNEEITPNDCIETCCPNGFYNPRWNGHLWVEGLTQEQITEIQLNQPKQLLTLEQIDDCITFLMGNQYD